MYGKASRDPDDVDDDVAAFIELKAFADGSLRVHGNIDDKPRALKMLDDARGIIMRSAARQPMGRDRVVAIVSTEADVVAVLQLKIRKNDAMSVGGNFDDGPYALAMLENGKDIVRNHNSRRTLEQGGAVIVPGKDTGLILPAGFTRA